MDNNKYIEFPLISGSLSSMQHFCAHRWNPRGRPGTTPSTAFREAFSHEEYDGSRTWMGQTSESRSIKLNQGQSRWIKVKSIVFGIKRVAALAAARREEFTCDGCHGSKNDELTRPPGLKIGLNRSITKNVPQTTFMNDGAERLLSDTRLIFCYLNFGFDTGERQL
jgi:hypothetical protein